MGLECGAKVSDRKGNKVSGQSVRLTDEQQALNSLDYRGLKFPCGMVNISIKLGVPVSYLEPSSYLGVGCPALARTIHGPETTPNR
jgi:hypothetical protein